MCPPKIVSHDDDPLFLPPAGFNIWLSSPAGKVPNRRTIRTRWTIYVIPLLSQVPLERSRSIICRHTIISPFIIKFILLLHISTETFLKHLHKHITLAASGQIYHSAVTGYSGLKNNIYWFILQSVLQKSMAGLKVKNAGWIGIQAPGKIHPFLFLDTDCFLIGSNFVLSHNHETFYQLLYRIRVS